MASTSRKRVTVKPKDPNPLFERWLTEWRDKAKENDSKMQYCFSLALKSLRKYPLPLETGKDCKILNGFGEKLCKMLDDKLEQYKAEGPSTSTDEALPIAPKVTKPNTKPKTQSPKNAQSIKEYIPQPGSGAYAILVTLFEKSLEPNYAGYLLKAEIIKHGQHLCNASFTKAGPDTRYTAWSSMKTLLSKNLVNKEGNPAKFSLTEEGAALGDTLFVQHKIQQFQNQVVEDKTHLLMPQASTSTQNTVNEAILGPNSFEIILLVDTQELNGSKSNVENDPIAVELKKLNIHYEVRNLKVGDYAWIACDPLSKCELILPYIVERKRMDDLGKSIKDNRFHEQKFRLKQCGIPNLIYLIENYGKNEHVGLPLTTLHQAAINTLVHDCFTVKFTSDGKASCQYLACLTNLFENLFKPKTLVKSQKEDLQQFTLDDDLMQLMTFKDFNKSSSKARNFKVKEMFIKHLLQIKGMSAEKALAIVNKYPTPKTLKLAYNEVGSVEGENLLSTLPYGSLQKKVGAVMSKIVYQFFCNNYK